MQIAAREGFVAAARGRMVEVEYLESTGTQWIDTGYVPHVPIDERYIALCTVPQWDGNWQGWFGTSASDSDRSLLFRQRTSSDSLQAYVPKSDANYYSTGTLAVTPGRRIEVRVAPFQGDTQSPPPICYVTYGGAGAFLSRSSTKHGTASTTNNYTVKLFSNSRAPTVTRRMRFYSFKIQNYSTNASIMDLQPVRVGRKGYMCDKVSGNLLANAGTGSFVIGPDIN